MITIVKAPHKVIGVWKISNAIRVKLLKIEYGINDTALIQYDNNEDAETCVIDYDKTEDACFIPVGENKLYFDDCIRFD